MSNNNNRLNVYIIYLITNNLDGRNYVGKHKLRKNEKPESRSYMGKGKHIQSSEKKWGIKNFSKEVLAICYSEDILNILEREYISLYRSIGKAEYNHADGGEGGHGKLTKESIEKIRLKNIGKKLSDETKRKLSEYHKNPSEETRKRMSDAQKRRTTHYRDSLTEEQKIELNKKISKSIKNSEKFQKAVHSQEFKEKISKAGLGRPSPTKGWKYSKEHCEKLSQTMLNMYNSPKGKEVKSKIREKRKEQIITEETRHKMSKAHKGHAVSEETKRKLSEVQKGHVVSEETKVKISAARQKQVFSEESKQKRKESIDNYWNSEEGQRQRKINSERNKSLKQTKGYHWYNNGVIQTVAKECPEGFVPGKLFNRKHTEEEKQARRDWYANLPAERKAEIVKKIGDGHRGIACSDSKKANISKANKGRKYYNNGVVEVMQFECPEGFVPGRCPKAKESISKGMTKK